VRLPAETEAFTSDLGRCHNHTARLASLAPATKYVYRVGDGVNWSEWFHFTTASEDARSFTFVYFGDAQNDIRSLWSRVVREAHADAPRASFMLHAGDLVNRANRDAEWGEWFGAGGWLNAMIPSIVTPGNHEYDGEPEESLSHHWRPQFALPENGPPGLEETAYWIDYQGVRMVSLNSNERHQEQAAWLDQVLARNPNTWTIVTFHHPIFSSGKDRDNPRLRRLWKPVLDKYAVDLVLQGHDHTYARTGLRVPENVNAGVNVLSGSTVYVVSVSGPKLYELQRAPFVQRAASGAQLYQIIHIDNDRLTYEARLATGELYDAFTLVKRRGEPNELIDQIPDTPELRKVNE
jgi:3',5'-cyclic AMP phosphodiesterase CpdA